MGTSAGSFYRLVDTSSHPLATISGGFDGLLAPSRYHERMDTPTQKFVDPHFTVDGSQRASVHLKKLETLWLNTGTLCNLTCANCYIESSPSNDALVYLTHDEALIFYDEIAKDQLGTEQIGITGGEPFMNPDIIGIMESALVRGFECLVLTNAMRPMMKHAEALLDLNQRFGPKLKLRVSVDHFNRRMHEEERGPKSWAPMLLGLQWLSNNGFAIDVAGRTRWGEDEATLRAGFQALFSSHQVEVDAHNPQALVLFPEMDENAPVPEITTQCWDLLGVNPDDMMCASSRMVVKRKGDEKPSVMACTLLAYDQQFNLGSTLKEASGEVALNHPHCAKFCVLGGGSCSVKE